MQQPNYAPYYNQQGYYPNNPYYPQYQSQWPAAARQTPYTHPSFFPQSSQGPQQRYNYSQPPPGSSVPLKSNLKRHGTAPATTSATPAVPTQTPKRRKRTKSNPQDPSKVAETTQHEHQRTSSNTKAPPQMSDYPTRTFLSLSGSDEIHIENISTYAMNEIRATIFPKWPHGMVLDELKDLKWKIKFSGSPWNTSGPSATKAWEMLLALFTLFSRRGYSFQTSISIGTSTPRLVFLATEIDSSSHFFFAHPLNGGRKITFIDPPTRIQLHLFPYLQETSDLSGHIEAKFDEEGTTFSIELRQGLYTAHSITPAHLLVETLQKLEELNVQLETSIPMARKGPFAKLGFGERPEFYLFKAVST
ncbi:hypothetical protein E1B28_001065 [Marasmius oreades]|uniref:Uncharacterized protein n=1 Tax=Marasmius oreades TaxID=181124 RepID=A0A9P7V2T2_9AGAR|nr:uncharacterized protein E1B28_001065 [Marasmius oreades]KAG7099198.1 hypothetical protein E1B28_001065 [Marasmius oreades]